MFIGASRDRDVFLIYEEDIEKLKDLALNLELARKLGKAERKKLVFAPTKYLDQEYLDRLNIEFCQVAVRNLPARDKEMIQLKEYQKETLAQVRVYLETLAEFRAKDSQSARDRPRLGIDWPAKAWEKVETGRKYFPRRNGLNEPLPSFCLKIPTGGGKTLLATKTIDLANTYFRKSNRGLVLWVVPTTQIYNQTLSDKRPRSIPIGRRSITRPAAER